ncbi:hypothetical protein SDC9_106164 [bioreactor metagenome]|uniref:Uncharacterized protein n=1 Tax=bioreactor metagenome TaxID=1076179 RepID=A0A645BC84_9ZZZZ
MPQPGEDRDRHKGNVRNNPVGGNPFVSLKTQNQEVEGRQHNRRGHFHDESGRSQIEDVLDRRTRQLVLQNSGPGFLSCEMDREDAQTDDRGKACRKCGTEHPHFEREKEYVVQDDVRNTAANHRQHGQSGVIVVPDESQDRIVQDEKWRKHHNRGHIGMCQRQCHCIGTQNR